MWSALGCVAALAVLGTGLYFWPVTTTGVFFMGFLAYGLSHVRHFPQKGSDDWRGSLPD